MAEVVELDDHHPQVAEASIQREALVEESGGPVVIAGHSSALGVHVERRLPHGRLERTGELARLGCKRASVVVLAVEEGRAAEPEVGECQRFRVLDRTSGFQRRFAARARVVVRPQHEGEQPVPVQRERFRPRGFFLPAVQHSVQKRSASERVAGHHPEPPDDLQRAQSLPGRLLSRISKRAAAAKDSLSERSCSAHASCSASTGLPEEVGNLHRTSRERSSRRRASSRLISRPLFTASYSDGAAQGRT